MKFFRPSLLLALFVAASLVPQFSYAVPATEIVSALDHVDGAFTTSQAVYADADRIYLGSYHGKVFVLSRNVSSNFPLIETIQMSSPVSSVRGDSQYLFVGTHNAEVYVFKKDHPYLTQVTSFKAFLFGHISMAIDGGDLYVRAGGYDPALDKVHGRLFFSALNPGESVKRFSIGTWVLNQEYIPGFYTPDTISAFDMETGYQFPDIDTTDSNLSRTKNKNLYADGQILAAVYPGCCGQGVTLYDPVSFERQQFISSSVPNAVARSNQTLIVGTELGRMELYDLSLKPSPRLHMFDARQFTGLTTPGEILEIRSIWKDDVDNLIFAATSWANREGTPWVPTFFVFELTDLSNTIRINAGGPYISYQDSSFSTDQYFSGGHSWSALQRPVHDSNGLPISDADKRALYLDDRYSQSSFSYNIPVVAGAYNVKLRFIEGDPSFVGHSPFTVKINEFPVLINFDVGTAAGGALKALDMTWVLSTSGNSGIKVEFINDTPPGRAMVSAIEVWPNGIPTPTPTASPMPSLTPSPTASPSPTPSPTPTPTVSPTPSLTPSPTASPSPIPSPTLTPTASPTPTSSAMPEPTSTSIPTATSTIAQEPTPKPTTIPPVPSPVDTRILGVNAGGSNYISSITQNRFRTDTAFAGGSRWNWPGISSKIRAIKEQNLYKSIRYSSSSFTYRFRQGDGRYKIRLHFLEGNKAQAKQSHFAVSINGVKVLNRFDVATAARGVYKAITKDFLTTARRGTGIRISFTNQSRKGRAMVSAIEIFRR